MRLDKLKYGVPKDDDEGGTGGRGGSGGGGDGGMPGLPPRMTVQEEMDDIIRRLDYLIGILLTFLQITLNFKIPESSLEKMMKSL